VPGPGEVDEQDQETGGCDAVADVIEEPGRQTEHQGAVVPQPEVVVEGVEEKKEDV
jgi:hypothetical protein